MPCCLGINFLFLVSPCLKNGRRWFHCVFHMLRYLKGSLMHDSHRNFVRVNWKLKPSLPISFSVSFGICLSLRLYTNLLLQISLDSCIRTSFSFYQAFHFQCLKDNIHNNSFRWNRWHSLCPDWEKFEIEVKNLRLSPFGIKLCFLHLIKNLICALAFVIFLEIAGNWLIGPVPVRGKIYTVRLFSALDGLFGTYLGTI